MAKLFNQVRGNRPMRSAFDLSHERLLTADMGYLYPVCVQEMLPGDFFDIGVSALVRAMPMAAPPMHEINVFFHAFFYPHRLGWTGWETFISGGIDGDDSSTIPRSVTTSTSYTAKDTLWDHFGFPTGDFTSIDQDTETPVRWPWYTYNAIYNQYYRDENFVTAVSSTNNSLLKRSWAKDYFTSALDDTQRGTSPAVPIYGTSSAEWDSNFNASLNWPTQVSSDQFTMYGNSNTSVPYDADTKGVLENGVADLDTVDLNDNEVDLTSADGFDISELRLAFQIQRFMELNMRAGVRYNEFLKAHWGVSNGDARLDRPEYIGGVRAPIIISEVLQTSESDTTPQGYLAGHGVGVARGNLGKYRSTEWGTMMVIMSIMPKSLYQQGIDRTWLRRTRYDYPNPAFVNLSEQAIENEEIYVSNVGDGTNRGIFGYQGRFDECRIQHSKVVGDMRDTFDYWHISRKFTSLPVLNQTFLECTPRKDFLADGSEPAFIVRVGNIIRAVRPLPAIAQPGLIDHV